MLLMVNAAVAQDMLCVYPHKASPDTLALQDVKSITHSRTDLNGVRHADFAVMEIELTNGRQRRYDITALDSVVMVKDGLHSHLVRFTGTMAARPSGAKPIHIAQWRLRGEESYRGLLLGGWRPYIP